MEEMVFSQEVVVVEETTTTKESPYPQEEEISLDTLEMDSHEAPVVEAPFIDVIVTLECIHLYIICIVPRCLFWDVFVM